MAGWDEDSAELRQNLAGVARRILLEAPHRPAPGLSIARDWHRQTMRGLDVPDPAFVGAFRGELGLEALGVRVGPCRGAPAGEVGAAPAAFIQSLRDGLAVLDPAIPPGARPETPEELEATLTLIALTHAHWVAIHPFANGNGRTARFWANWIAVRYGLPMFVRLRPRPSGSSYADAARAALCDGDYQPSIAAFRELFEGYLSSER